jgi:hypothetical protein
MSISFQFPTVDTDINATQRAVLLALIASGNGITTNKADDMLASDLILKAQGMVTKEPT